MKKRIDILLFEKGMAESREKARAIIMSGCVFADGARVDKPGTNISIDADIQVKGSTLPYVSRGGLKIEKAFDTFQISPKDAVCIDCGASTGGFTDCLLKRGAIKVYAVDVGYGQLAWSLRNDPRVVCMERTNVRYLTDEMIPEKLDIAVIDVSFISLRLILPPVRKLLKDSAKVICLIKPQFEAGREKVGKKGVIRDPETHREVLTGFFANAAEADFSVKGLSYSPIKGPEGNIEYLGYLVPGAGSDSQTDINGIVEQSHLNLE